MYSELEEENESEIEIYFHTLYLIIHNFFAFWLLKFHTIFIPFLYFF